MLVEVYLLRCGPGGRLAYRREARLLRAGEAPDAAARRAGTSPGSRDGGLVTVLHSTSWRHLDDGTIVLSYAAVPDPEPGRRAVPITGFEMASSGDPRRPSPAGVRHDQVAAHAARHLALLAGTDPVVRRALDAIPGLSRALEPLAPAPAGGLAHGGGG